MHEEDDNHFRRQARPSLKNPTQSTTMMRYSPREQFEQGEFGLPEDEADSCRLLLTLPIYNESQRLETTTETLLAYLRDAGHDFQISLVEDGSTDGSYEVARQLSTKHSEVTLFHAEERLGRGEAIRRCWSTVNADIYIFMDADLATDVKFLPRLIDEIRNGADLVTGSRYCKGARVSRPILRQVVSLAYNSLVRGMFRDGIHDHQCGFKAFSRRGVDELLARTSERSWFWDTEVLVLGRLLQYRVSEIPVDWHEVKVGRTPLTRLLGDVFLHGTGLLRLRRRVKQLSRDDSRSHRAPDRSLENRNAMAWSNTTDPDQASIHALLLVNNYSETGIGDFGEELRLRLLKKNISVETVTTPSEWSGFLDYLMRVLRYPGRAVFNIGLTSWGRSPIRNFIGFASIRARAILGKRNFVLLHNLIEVIDQNTSGFAWSPIVELGAHLAVNQLRNVPLAVFSGVIERLLVEHYNLKPRFWQPLPMDGQAATFTPHRGPPTLIAFGYISPYKNYRLLLESLRRVDIPLRVLIAGNAHKVLGTNPVYRQYVEDLLRQARELGVVTLPRIPSSQLPEIMANVDLGLLPYDSCKGASAVASMLASFGIPILATDIATFRELEREGCGIVLSPADPVEFATRIEGVIRNPDQMATLRWRQRQFRQKYSWDLFVQRLLLEND